MNDHQMSQIICQGFIHGIFQHHRNNFRKCNQKNNLKFQKYFIR